MKTICCGPVTTKGIDMYQGDLIANVTLLKPGGIQFAFLKVFEYVEDTRFASRWASMQKNGILRGAYDFFHPEEDPVEQAVQTVQMVGTLGALDMIWLDWESTGGVAGPQLAANAKAWLNTVWKATGKKPGIYGSPYNLESWTGGDPFFGQFINWIAHYGVKCPLVPSSWNSLNFWQTTGGASVAGMAGPCDTDVFNGTLDELTALLKAQNVPYTA